MSPRGGYIGKQLIPFQLGLGGQRADGTHQVSWISLDDEVGAIRHLLDSEITGPVNLTAPHPVTNARWTKALGAALHRPTIIPFPLPIARLIFGDQFVAEAMLSSQKVLPTTLTESGYTFTDTEIEPTLERLFHD